MILLSALLILSVNLFGEVAGESNNLQTAKEWKLFTYNFLPHAPVNDLKFYNPSNVLATGVAVNHDRIFIATPKLFSGVPSTVSFVSKTKFGDSPVLQAFPDWTFSTTNRKDFNCSDLVLISVYRMRIDSCNRIWLLDAGVSRSLEDFEVTCPPKILIIDLNTDQVVRRVDFPSEILRGESLFTNLVIDETTSRSGTCDDVYVYISDTVEPAIIVYDSGRDVTWRVSHPAMYPDPDFAQSEIFNDRFILMDGVVGLTFDPKLGIVYFQPLATDRIFSVTKEVLRSGPLPQNEVLQVKLVGKKSSQGIGLAVSPTDSSLIFSPLSETAVASWNPKTNEQSVLAFDRDRLQFVADISSTPHETDTMYIVSSKFHRFFLKNLNQHEINNRILRLELPRSTLTTKGLHTTTSKDPFNAKTPNVFSNFLHTNYPNKRPTYNSGRHTPVTYSNHLTNTDASTSLRYHHPYTYESVGVINYSLRNPFTALNHGESFPPSKEQRSRFDLSFLDRLTNNEPKATTPALSAMTVYDLPKTGVPNSEAYTVYSNIRASPLLNAR